MMHGFLFQGFKACQHDDVALALYALFTKVKPARVVEVGTADGGFTLVLRYILDTADLPTTPVLTYDILYNVQLAYLIKMRQLLIEMRAEDVFTDLPALKTYIEQPGPTTVFCDGGNKPLEINTIAPLLKPGDVILAHDYSPSLDYHKEITSKVWRACETTDADITADNLEPFMAEVMTPVIWACRRKV